MGSSGRIAFAKFRAPAMPLPASLRASTARTHPALEDMRKEIPDSGIMAACDDPLFMGLIFFPMIGLGPFAVGAGLGIAPATLSLGMVLTYSIVLGTVYIALDPRGRIRNDARGRG